MGERIAMCVLEFPSNGLERNWALFMVRKDCAAECGEAFARCALVGGAVAVGIHPALAGVKNIALRAGSQILARWIVGEFRQTLETIPTVVVELVASGAEFEYMVQPRLQGSGLYKSAKLFWG